MKQLIAEQIVENRFEESGFHGRMLADLELPHMNFADGPGDTAIPYAVLGGREAPHLVFATSPYGCRVSDESQLIRLKAQQIALGDEACVVGLHVYEPRSLELTSSERKLVSSGNFRPYADRVLSVIEAVEPRDDQKVSLYGFSMGADVSIETAYQVVTDAQRGIIPIDRLGAVEPARSTKRGAIAVAKAFSSSGPDLFDNVLASRSPALLEARGIDPRDPKAKKKHDKDVGIGVTKDFMSDIAGGVANMRGFANDASLAQLNELIELDMLPRTSIGRATGSTICPPEFTARLRDSSKVETFSVSGDHSLADNIRRGAALMVRTVLL